MPEAAVKDLPDPEVCVMVKAEHFERVKQANHSVILDQISQTPLLG